MKENSFSNFGLVIAFLLPGFTALWGVSYFSETVRQWLSATDATAPTVGGFMYVTLASIAAGVTVSTVRWAIIDTIHRWTGLPQPRWDFAHLQENVEAYKVLNEVHYRFYQFHGNMLIALIFAFASRRIHSGLFVTPFGWIDLGFLGLSVILFAGSRDTLHKYFSRVSRLLGAKPYACKEKHQALISVPKVRRTSRSPGPLWTSRQRRRIRRATVALPWQSSVSRTPSRNTPRPSTDAAGEAISVTAGNQLGETGAPALRAKSASIDQRPAPTQRRKNEPSSME